VIKEKFYGQSSNGDQYSVKDFVQYGRAQLRDRLQKENQNRWQADAFEKANVQARIDAVKGEIAQAQMIISKKMFFCEYTYSTGNEKSYGDESSCTISIPHMGFDGKGIRRVSCPMPIKWQESTIPVLGRGIALSIDGSTGSIKELVRNSDNYRARVVFTNLRFVNCKLQADVQSIEIIEVR
jgi:hypothetical protein